MVARIVGRGLPAFGMGGGGAAVCGAAASADIVDEEGTWSTGIVAGGCSGRWGEIWGLLRNADMKALRVMIVDARHGALHAKMCRWWATRSDMRDAM